jgi:hypothetical protein
MTYYICLSPTGPGTAFTDKARAESFKQSRLNAEHCEVVECVTRDEVEQNESLRELLISAHAIANRRGVDTAWERFANSCKKLGVSDITARTYKILPHDKSINADPSTD